MKYLLLITILISSYSIAQNSTSSRLVIVGTTSTASTASKASFSSTASSIASTSRSSIASSASSSSSSPEVVINPDETMTIALAWAPPTHREDGTPLVYKILNDKGEWITQYIKSADGTLKPIVDLGGYEIRYKRTGTKEWVTSVYLPGSAKNYKLTGLAVGQYDIEVAAITRYNLYSTFVDAKGVGPKPVENLRTATQIVKPTLKPGD